MTSDPKTYSYWALASTPRGKYKRASIQLIYKIFALKDFEKKLARAKLEELGLISPQKEVGV